MKELKELVKNSESNINELPNEYLKEAKKLADKRIKEEDEYRKKLSSKSGRDDRMNVICKELDLKFRQDIEVLRKKHNLV